MRMALSIAGVGMVTAIGGTTRETITAFGRGARRAARTSLVDLHGDRIVGSFVLPVDAGMQGAARASTLALPALRECLASAGPSSGSSALFVCAPSPWGSVGADFAPVLAPVREEWSTVADRFAVELEARGVVVPRTLRFVIARGHAAGALALERAAGLLGRREAEQAWIVGLDSYGERATLERLSLAGVLKSRRTPEGFLPGEAAAVLCVRPATREAPGIHVGGIGIATESDAPSTARALTSAVARSIETWGGKAAAIATVVTDLNGQRERAKEWTFTAARTLWRELARPVVTHPVSLLGDTGAATVPLLVALTSGQNQPGPVLTIASSMDGLRGGVVLTSSPAHSA